MWTPPRNRAPTGYGTSTAPTWSPVRTWLPSSIADISFTGRIRPSFLGRSCLCGTGPPSPGSWALTFLTTRSRRGCKLFMRQSMARRCSNVRCAKGSSQIRLF
ncbi:hypothetical protein LAZ67_8000358 [Cordylochernes scorpioides]|uniref:Uncharacterized protein n=1 Tax=Cordylochernes scorpioides TaxID=51811 RepID=A0ABY6KPX8_9ARAC|nr:hypothetical protein LAZ67_8000358 [Cordylochernes scorpioides]